MVLVRYRVGTAWWGHGLQGLRVCSLQAEIQKTGRLALGSQ